MSKFSGDPPTRSRRRRGADGDRQSLRLQHILGKLGFLADVCRGWGGDSSRESTLQTKRFSVAKARSSLRLPAMMTPCPLRSPLGYTQLLEEHPEERFPRPPPPRPRPPIQAASLRSLPGDWPASASKARSCSCEASWLASSQKRVRTVGAVHCSVCVHSSGARCDPWAWIATRPAARACIYQQTRAQLFQVAMATCHRPISGSRMESEASRT